MNKKHRNLISWGIVISAFCAILDAFTSSAQNPAQSIGGQMVTQTAGGLKDVFELLRVVGGIFGMIMTGVGFWVYYKATVKNQTGVAMQNTIDVQHDELVALRDRSERLHNDLTSMLESNKGKDVELTALRARTDLTALISEQRKFNEALVKGFSEVNSRSEKLIKDSSDILVKQLDYLSKCSRDILEAEKVQQELLKSLFKEERRG